MALLDDEKTALGVMGSECFLQDHFLFNICSDTKTVNEVVSGAGN